MTKEVGGAAHGGDDMTLSHRLERVPAFGLTFVCLFLVGFTASPAALPDPSQSAEPFEFAGAGHTAHGDWQGLVSVSPASWRPGDTIQLDVALHFANTHLASLADAGIKADKLCLLVTAERTFDADGWMRLPSDERMSTLLTPAGLAIEGGVQGAVTPRYGYQFRSPLDQFLSISTTQTEVENRSGMRLAKFSVRPVLPVNLPPGLYRLRFDFGVMAGTRVYNFNGFTFASRPSATTEADTSTYFYSPVIPASGAHVSGRVVAAASIQPRFPWLLLSNYNSNGYRGVVADEDKSRFAASDRSLIPDEVILPMFDDNGNRLSYSLEPQFPVDTIDVRSEHPLGLEHGRAFGKGLRTRRQHGRPWHAEDSWGSPETGRLRRLPRSRVGDPRRTASTPLRRPVGFRM